jgi:aminopeptidase N
MKKKINKLFLLKSKNYLNVYSYSTAVQDNLWEQLTKQAREDGVLDESVTMKDIMDTWTLQKGYPVLTVTRRGANQISLAQKWFLLNPLNSIQSTDEYAKNRWHIPFTYTTKEELNFNFESFTYWFRPDQQECIENKYLFSYTYVFYYIVFN